jgi:uncharacterized membrane protein
MMTPPLWLWVLACSFTGAGLLLSRFAAVDRFLARLPLWLIALVLLAWFVVAWWSFNVFFGFLVVRFVLP